MLSIRTVGRRLKVKRSGAGKLNRLKNHRLPIPLTRIKAAVSEKDVKTVTILGLTLQ